MKGFDGLRGSEKGQENKPAGNGSKLSPITGKGRESVGGPAQLLRRSDEATDTINDTRGSSGY